MAAHPDDQTPPKGGRRARLTEDLALMIASYIEDGNFRAAAAKAHGIGYTTLRTWIRTGKKFPDGLYGQFRTLVMEAEAKAEVNAVRRLLEQAGAGDSASLRFYLERRFHKYWSKARSEFEGLKQQLRALERQVGVNREPPAGEPRG